MTYTPYSAFSRSNWSSTSSWKARPRRRAPEFKTDNKRTRKVYNHIHRGLHNPGHTKIMVDNVAYPIGTKTDGMRYVRIGKITFSQQNPAQKTVLAKRARTENVTRIMRSGLWGYIADSEIVDPQLVK